MEKGHYTGNAKISSYKYIDYSRWREKNSSFAVFKVDYILTRLFFIVLTVAEHGSFRYSPPQEDQRAVPTGTLRNQMMLSSLSSFVLWLQGRQRYVVP